jgi:hypothetical protein
MNKDFPSRQRKFGELLARYLNERNCYDSDLANEINVLPEFVDQWLNEKLHSLKGKHVAKLVRFFELTDDQEDELLATSGCRRAFGKLLEFYMCKNGFSSNALARQIGVPTITVCRWVNEAVRSPRCESVKEVANALNILTLPPQKVVDFFLLANCAPPIETKTVVEVIENNDVAAKIDRENQDEMPAEIIKPIPIPGIPISHPCQFFGRLDILKRLRRAWQQPSALQHVAIIGKRRSGKTSLLKYLQYISKTPPMELRSGQPQGWNGWLPRNFQFVFIDFQYFLMTKPANLLSHILDKLNLPKPNNCDLINFSQVLDEHLTKPTVMLFDEIGAGLQAPDLDATFWSNMRALGNNCADGKLGFVVTAHEPIQTLAKDNRKESPFFNIFGHTVHLKPLAKTEALELINGFARPLPAADTDWLLQNSGGWPALLQLLCDARLHALEEGNNGDKWKTEGLERTEPFVELLKG